MMHGHTYIKFAMLTLRPLTYALDRTATGTGYIV